MPRASPHDDRCAIMPPRQSTSVPNISKTRARIPFMDFVLSLSVRFSAERRRPALHGSHGEVDSDQRSGRVRLRTLTLETTMPAVADRHDAPTAIQSNLAAIFISLELS